MEKTLISIRVDKETKEQAAAIFSSIGLNLSSAVVAFLNETIAEGKIPFELKAHIQETTPLHYAGMYLFYNPIEYPSKVHLRSEKLGIDKVYAPWEAGAEDPCSIDSLIKLANNTDDYDDVSIYVTRHNQAYFKRHKNMRKPDCIAYEASGWISLKGVKNGGGYLDDKWPINIIIDKEGNTEEV